MNSTASLKALNKKYYTTALIKRTINTLMIHLNMSIEEFELVYALLKNRIDCISYLVLMSSKIVKEDEPEDIFTMIEDLINTAYFIHLKNLITQIDHKISLTNKNTQERLMPLYLKFEENIIKGRYVSYYTNFYSCILPRDFQSLKLDNTIIFPPRFIYWTPDDLIEQAIEYNCLDSVYDDEVYSIIHSKLYSFVYISDCPDFIKHCMIYYYMSTAKERLNLYEEELIQKTWKPSRLITFCLSEDEKIDFEPE